MNTTKKKYLYLINFSLVSFFSFAWFKTRPYFDNFPDQLLQFDILTFISIIVFILILKKITEEFLIHLWTILMWIFITHYIQFYLIIFWLLHSSPFLEFISYLNIFLTNSIEQQVNDIILVYQVSVASIIGYAIAIYRIKINTLFSVAETKTKKTSLNKKPDDLSNKFNAKLIKKLAFLLILINIVSLYLQYEIIVLAETGDVLPFRMQGIVFYTNRIIIPLAYSAIIYILEMNNFSSFSNRILTIFIINSFLLSLIVESRLPVPLSLFSLITIWIVTGKMTKKRIIFLLLFSLSIPILIFIPSTLRRLSGPNLVENIATSFQLLQQQFTFIQENQDSSKLNFYFIYPILRLNGAISIFPVLGSDILNNSWEYIWGKFAELDYSSDLFYKVYVMKIPLDVKLGLSSGFTSNMYILSAGNNIFVSFSMFLYTITWHKIIAYFYSQSNDNRFPKMFIVSLLSLFFLISGNMVKMLTAMFFLIILIWLSDRFFRMFTNPTRKIT
ncbi:hypothetical protein [Geminocystis sp.]|uniref:hypothetical protein n=1 Tax=Geminocystis sp. TaxID=2664100 RepID=UPI00359475BD